jgi:hypothetical protein
LRFSHSETSTSSEKLAGSVRECVIQWLWITSSRELFSLGVFYSASGVSIDLPPKLCRCSNIESMRGWIGKHFNEDSNDKCWHYFSSSDDNLNTCTIWIPQTVAEILAS